MKKNMKTTFALEKTWPRVFVSMCTTHFWKAPEMEKKLADFIEVRGEDVDALTLKRREQHGKKQWVCKYGLHTHEVP